MKKVYLFSLILLSAFMLKAQNIDDIRKYILLKQYQKGKEEVEKYLNDPSNAKKADGWYYKAFIYNVMSRDSLLTITQSNNYNKEAFTAIKKYRELDPKESLTKEDHNGIIYNVYYGYYDLAIKAYNTKDFAQSYTNFNNTLEIHDYIFSNNLEGLKGSKFSSLDTDVVFNLIILGNELKKTEELVPFYKKLVDANLKDEKFLEAYEGIVMYYKNAKNLAGFNEYLEKGKQNFPKDNFWEAIDIEFAVEGLEKEALFKKYDELIVKYPNNYALFFNYGYEFNKYVYSGDQKIGDKEANKVKLAELFKKAIAINSTIDANMMLANFYYNNSYDITEEARKITGNKPDDVKKRTELNTASKNSLNMCLPVAEEAVRLFTVLPKLKGSDKVNYKQALDMLSTIYKINGDTKKSDEYIKKKEVLDKL